MATKKQQTHAKRARELAVKERRELKRAKKALRAAGELPPTAEDENGDPDGAADLTETVLAGDVRGVGEAQSHHDDVRHVEGEREEQ